MANQQNSRRTWLVLGLSALLTVGMVAVAPEPAEAGHSDRGWHRGWRNRDRDGDGIRNGWDRQPNRWNRRGRRNGNWRRNVWRTPRYNYPGSYQYGSYRYGSYRYRRNDLDRDGIPNYRDRDRDGDGVTNWRDRYPNSRWRR